MPKPPDNNAANAFALVACEEQIENLTPDSPVEERIAAAIALVALGSSVNNAANTTFLAPRTVWDRVHKDPKRLDERDKHIEAQAMEGILRAGEKINELLETEGAMRPAEVVKAYDSFARVAALLRKWNAPPPAPPEPEKKSALRELIDELAKQREAVEKKDD